MFSSTTSRPNTTTSDTRSTASQRAEVLPLAPGPEAVAAGRYRFRGADASAFPRHTSGWDESEETPSLLDHACFRRALRKPRPGRSRRPEIVRGGSVDGARSRARNPTRSRGRGRLQPKLSASQQRVEWPGCASAPARSEFGIGPSLDDGDAVKGAVLRRLPVVKPLASVCYDRPGRIPDEAATDSASRPWSRRWVCRRSRCAGRARR